uniref:Uncharacterized protein n=1 Tax=Clandestinovirus TaxID=2831644 RepID=A0A8F8KP20_9VIRU|nr:hypothetical protein KOM_12_182 [Clandestinovirus]
MQFPPRAHRVVEPPLLKSNVIAAKEGDNVVILSGCLTGMLAKFVRWNDKVAVLYLDLPFPNNVFVKVAGANFVPLTPDYDIHPECELILHHDQVKIVYEAQKNAGHPRPRKRRYMICDGEEYNRCFYLDQEDCECVHGPALRHMGLFDDDF